MLIVLCRRKFHVRVTELEEQINALITKCSGLEKQKSRLQSEVEVLIIDLEKVNQQIWIIEFFEWIIDR